MFNLRLFWNVSITVILISGPYVEICMKIDKILKTKFYRFTRQNKLTRNKLNK